MNKIKNWIRIKLKKFLDIENLEQQLDGYAKLNNRKIGEINSEISCLKNTIAIDSRDYHHRINNIQNSVNILHSTVENVVHIGTDVSINKYDCSWCVICIEGKINVVKFVNLGREDAMNILHYIKRFEAGKHCVNTPYGEIFYDNLFKF